MICRISVCEKTTFRLKYKYRYISVDFFGQIKKHNYILVEFVLANTNLFGNHLFDQYKYKYIWTYLNSANMNTNLIIQTDIWKYKYKYEYIPHTINYMLMNINATKYAS